MTNNTEDFEQEGFDELEEQPKKGQATLAQNVANAWQTKPVFKLIVIMFMVGLAVAAALGAFSSPPDPANSTIVTAPEMHEAPGGKSSPYFIEQNKQANAQRANEALQKGGSAIPTPVGNPVDIDDLTNPNKKDPLLEFRAETEKLKEEMKQQQQQQAMQMQGLQQQVQVASREPEDDSLAKAMQRQMQQLMEGWAPRGMHLVAGTTPKEDPAKTAIIDGVREGAQAASLATPASQAANEKAMIAAGTVNYAQLLTEANSDVQAPILAQILSGPLSGGRAVGRFQVMNDYLVMEFTLVTLKGKDYSIDAIALDPNTTLAGLATEVDHRYFTRILLPAAGAFVSSFGSTLSQGGSTTTVTDSTVLVTQAKKSYTDAMYAGAGAAGSAAAQFFQNQANQTKTLVRVAVGTPLGMFFLTSVKENPAPSTAQQTVGGALAAGYQQALQGGVNTGGYTVIGQQNNSSATSSNAAYNSAGTGYYGAGTTAYNPYSSYGSPSSVTMYPNNGGYMSGYYNRY